MDTNNLAILVVECGEPFWHAAVHKTGRIGNGRGCCGRWPWNLSEGVKKNVIDYRNDDFGDDCDWNLLSTSQNGIIIGDGDFYQGQESN